MAIIKNPSIVVPQDYKVVWNQLAVMPTIAVSGSGVGLPDSEFWRYTGVNLTAGHIYFRKGFFSGTYTGSFFMYESNAFGQLEFLRSDGVSATIAASPATVTGGNAIVYLTTSDSSINGTYTWECIDLTQMFGSGNEPTTTAEFESWLQENNIDPDSYIPLDYGTLRSMTKPSWIV